MYGAMAHGMTYSGPHTCPRAALILVAFVVLPGVVRPDRCELPKHWAGEWWDVSDRLSGHNAKDASITYKSFGGNNICKFSSGNKYLMKENDCYYCYIITEKHPNLLEYKKSSCEETMDLSTVCSYAESKDDIQKMIRKDAVVTCPFVGSRNFTFQHRFGGCSEKPSSLTSRKKDTELLFLYNPCPDQVNPNIVPFPNPVKCVAKWSEGSTHFFMGRLQRFPDIGERFSCYKYTEVKNENYRYSMSQSGTYLCGDVDKTYKIFDAQKVNE